MYVLGILANRDVTAGEGTTRCNQLIKFQR